MSLSIYTYSNPYEINNEPYWDSIRNCAHFCVSQTMVNGLSAVYDELDNGQLATVEELVEALYPGWFDTKTYIEQYTILTNTLDKVTPNIEPDRWKKIKQSLRFNKSALLDSIRLMAEMGLLLKNIKIKKITEEQMYLVATYNAILRGEDAKIFALKKNFSESEIDNAVKTALVAKDKRRGKEVKSIESVDCNTVVIHGIHQFTPTILSMLEEVSKYKRVVLLFNYQQQYNEIYQTWLDVYSCFDLNIKSQFNNEFKPTTLLQPSYEGNMLADQIGKLSNGIIIEKSKDINNVKVVEFDNITEFSAYVARIYEEAAKDFHADEHKNGSVLSYMKEQFYSANNSVNDILKVYFPEQFGERHFLAYPIGHFFVGRIIQVDDFTENVTVAFLDPFGFRNYYENIPEKAELPYDYVKRCTLHRESYVIYRENRYKILSALKADEWYYYYLKEEFTDKVIKIREDVIDAPFNGGRISPAEQLRSYEFQNPAWYFGRNVVSKTVKVLDNSVFGFKELAGCKIFLKEHQLRTIMRCLQEKNCRVMLADEVGMGKTIEAASVLKVYTLHNSNKRVLIAVPRPLVAQWRAELLIKFEITPGNNVNDNYVELIAEEDIEERMLIYFYLLYLHQRNRKRISIIRYIMY